MKKTIALICLSVIGFTALAKPDTTNAKGIHSEKAKPDTVKPVVKPEYKPDANQVFHISLDVSEGQVFSIMATSDGSLERSPNFNGAQIGQIKDEAMIMRNMINQQVADQKLKAYQKWQADTAAANKPKPKPIKTK